MLTGLQRTPLHEAHIALGARMVPFAGFDMPVQYDSIKEEHAAVRQTAGLFDVSHMGQIHFVGPEAVATVERLVSCPVASQRVPPPGSWRAIVDHPLGNVVEGELDPLLRRQAADLHSRLDQLGGSL